MKNEPDVIIPMSDWKQLIAKKTVIEELSEIVMNCKDNEDIKRKIEGMTYKIGAMEEPDLIIIGFTVKFKY